MTRAIAVGICLISALLICDCSKSGLHKRNSKTLTEPKPIVKSPAQKTPAGELKQLQTDLETLFDLNTLPEIEITVSVEEWNRLLQNFDINSQNEEAIKADFCFTKNDVRFQATNVGMRLKGNTFSRKRPEGTTGELHNATEAAYHPAHFKIDFDAFVKDQKFLSQKSLALKWFKDDPAYVREVYCFDLFRRFGVTIAPRSSYCRLTIRFKGETKPLNYGVFRMNEALDSVYVRSRFTNNNNGFLWKCLWPSDLVAGTAESRMGIENIPLTGPAATWSYDLKTRKKEFTNTAKPNFTAFIDNLNYLEGAAFKKWIEEYFDVPMLLRAMAVNVAVAMWDDYWGNQNNFYLYFDESGRGYFIPYDYDLTLGSSDDRDVGLLSALNWGNYPEGSRERPLIQKVLEIPEYMELYKQYLAKLTDPKTDYFSFTASSNRIAKWQTMVAPYVSNDTGINVKLQDRPADWGACYYYRLLTGVTPDEGKKPYNFFKTRCQSIRAEIGVF